MGKLFLGLSLSFAILFVVNLTFIIINLIFWFTNGLQALLLEMNFIERIYYSTYLRWILLADGLWFFTLLIFMLKRKHYKTDPQLHYLNYDPIEEQKICVIVPTYNEEENVERVVTDYINEKNVECVIVVDNNSSDKTVEIAKRCGAITITKDSNKGFAHSCVVGLKESLKTKSNIIAFTECDGTFSAYDLEKMIPYLDNSHIVIGTRQVQVLTQQGNQNSMFYVWGNFLLAKLIQIKYFSLLHLGIVQLTDVGCMHRCIRRDALEKIIEEFTFPGTDEVKITANSGLFAIFMTTIGIENNLKIVEIPVTFKKRIGISKTESDKKTRAIKYGLTFLWYIIYH